MILSCRRPAVLLMVLCSLVGRVSPARGDETESLKALVRAQGVAGREEPVRRAIRSRLPAASRPEVDNLGNLTLVFGSGRPVRMLLAAMDEPGYVVTRIQDDGYLRLQRLTRLPLSPLYDQFLVGQPVQIGTDSPERFLTAVAAVLSTHLQRGRRADAAPTPADEDLVIDAGARSAAEAQAAGVRILAPVTLEKDLAVLAGSRVAGPALDDRAGCAALLELAGKLDGATVEGQVVLAWTAQSWVGFRGAERLAHRFEPDEVLVVDPYAPDPTDAPARSPEGALGKGPLLGRSDGAAKAASELGDRLRRAAQRGSIPIQEIAFGSLHDGKPFAGRASTAVAVVGVPLRFPGTPAEMIDLKDLRDLVQWLASYLQR